jgi:hypothetical protein
VTHFCNTNYLEGWGQKVHGSRLAPQNSLQDPYLQIRQRKMGRRCGLSKKVPDLKAQFIFIAELELNPALHMLGQYLPRSYILSPRLCSCRLCWLEKISNAFFYLLASYYLDMKWILPVNHQKKICIWYYCLCLYLTFFLNYSLWLLLFPWFHFLICNRSAKLILAILH